MKIGVLALQGDFAEHIRILQSMNINSKEVRTVEDLEGIEALILPGGESTTMHLLLKSTGLDAAIKQSSLPLYGTCAGAILLADLGLIDIQIQRNAYGRQLDSFRTTIDVQGSSVPVAFIRAPKITAIGSRVKVLAMHQNNPVLVQQGNILVSTFHTEVTGSIDMHLFFISSVLLEFSF